MHRDQYGDCCCRLLGLTGPFSRSLVTDSNYFKLRPGSAGGIVSRDPCRKHLCGLLRRGVPFFGNDDGFFVSREADRRQSSESSHPSIVNPALRQRTCTVSSATGATAARESSPSRARRAVYTVYTICCLSRLRYAALRSTPRNSLLFPEEEASREEEGKEGGMRNARRDSCPTCRRLRGDDGSRGPGAYP